MEHMVKIEGVCKKHGSKQILEDISFTARSGRITAFLGPNGAGKSSTLRILLGRQQGRRLLMGKPISQCPIRSER